MKKCVNCGKKNDGNFCVFCGNELIEIKEKNKIKKFQEESQKENIIETELVEEKEKIPNNNKIFVYSTIILSIIIIIIAGFLIATIIDNKEIKETNQSLKNQISKLQKETSSIAKENQEYFLNNIRLQNKVDFFDENIVFVIDGYGRYYYTYDQMEQVTQGKSYSYWAYNTEQAKSLGYKAWKNKK